LDITLYNTNKVLFYSSIAVIVFITLIVLFRISIWNSTGWVGIYFAPGEGEYVEVNDTLEIDHTHTSVIARVQSETPAHRAGLVPGDTILTVNGIAGFDVEKLRALNNDISPGETLHFEVNRGGETFIISAVLESVLKNNQVRIQLITTFFVSFVFFLFGLFVLYKKPGDKRVVVFHLMCISTGTVLLIGSIVNPELSYGIGIFSVSKYIGLIFLGAVIPGYYSVALLIHFTLIFPVQRPSIQKYPYIKNWLYGLPSVVFLIITTVPLLAYTYLVLFEDYQIITSFDVGYVVAEYFTLSFPLSSETVSIILVIAFLSITLFLLILRKIKMIRGSAGYLRTCLYSPHLCFLMLYFFLIAATGILSLTINFTVSEINNIFADFIIFGSVLGIPILFLIIIFIASTFLFPLVIIINLILSYREGTIEHKRQIRWPLWGIGTAVLGSLVFSIPYILEEINIMIFNRIIYNLFEFIRIAVYALIPVTIVIATIKYRLMDIDIIIKKTVTYSILSVIIIALYLVLVLWIGGYVVSLLEIQTYWITTTATIAIAIAFIPLRIYLQRIIDRRFHRKKTDYNAAIEYLQNKFHDSSSSQLADSVLVEQLQAVLQVRTVFIMQLQADTSTMPVSARLGVPDDLSKISITSNDYKTLINIKHPLSLSELDLSDSLSSQLKRFRCEIGAPVKIKNEMKSIIWIGRKLSDFPFDDDDLHFISRAADVFGRIIQDAQLQERDIDYSRASEIQRALLPQTIPDIRSCTIAASWHPARTVAGDYYDIIKLNDTKAAVCIADVVGKGMPAALLMSNLQALVRAYASDEMPPADLCKKVNMLLSGNIPKGKFITFLIGIFDTSSMQFQYCNAGHNRPIIIRSGGTHQVLKQAGPALGMMNTYEYRQLTEPVRSGDRIVFYTDGITEAMNHNREEFGDERLMHLLKEGASRTVSELHDRIVSEVKSFSGADLRDDVTLVIIEIQ